MCGVAGFFASINEEHGNEVLASMSSLLKHRGPDSQSHRLIDLGNGQKIGLAHSLLSIIGAPGEGKQPFEVPGGVLIFNGAIYNFEELAQRLKVQGTVIRTKTDTEVLAHGLARDGADFLKHVRGMFAFAFWDNRRNLLILGRDPFGVKPLYFHQSKGLLCFASEYKALIPHLPNLSINDASALEYLRYRYVPGHATMISGIQKMPQGTAIEFDPLSQSLKTVGYFEPSNQSVKSTESLFAVLETAVKRRAVADVEVGALLSGGIDSAVVCDILEQSVQSLHTYTLKMDDLSTDESHTAQRISQRIGTVHTTIPPNKGSIEELRGLIYHLDDPYGDPIILALNRIFTFISGKQRVLVTGEGADEIFSGYVHHRAAGFLDKIPHVLLNTFAQALNCAPSKLLRLLLPYAGKMSDEDFSQAIRRMSRMVASNDLASFQSIFYLFDDQSINRKSFSQLPAHPKSSQSLSSVREWDFRNWLPDSQLFKLDKISMASSIEAREPYVDQDLVAAVNAVPARKHFSILSDKPVFRKLIANRTRLDSKVISSRKSSFFQPFGRNATGQLHVDLCKQIELQTDFLHHYVAADQIHRVLTSTDTGLLSQKRTFALGTLALWKEAVWSQRSKGYLLGKH